VPDPLELFPVVGRGRLRDPAPACTAAAVIKALRKERSLAGRPRLLRSAGRPDFGLPPDDPHRADERPVGTSSSGWSSNGDGLRRDDAIDRHLRRREAERPAPGGGRDPAAGRRAKRSGRGTARRVSGRRAPLEARPDSVDGLGPRRGSVPLPWSGTALVGAGPISVRTSSPCAGTARPRC